MTKHTPGPWRWNGKDRDVVGAVGNPETIARTFGDTLTEQQANARLIAAAPEMFDLLARVAAHFADTDAPLGVDARALLARIQGEDDNA